MNTINVKVNFKNGSCDVTGINLITGDYNSTKMVFEFDRDTGTKVFEMKSPSEQLVMVQEIQNNEIILYGLDEDENIASILNEEGYYVFEISLYENESKLTSARGKIKVKPEQVIVDGEVVEAYLPIFDQLLSQVNTAITQTNNLNLASSKSGKITTITITKKDGTTETRQVLDGDDFEYNWSGTQLGVKTSAESDYTYVDLKGDKGDAGAIKMLIVAELPATGADDTIYLVPLENPDVQGNNYAEYVYINGAWELLGKIGVQVDLTDYVKFTDYATTNKGGVIKSGSYSFNIIDGKPYADTLTYANYQSFNNGNFISKGTLENVITGKGLVSNTDYANTTTGGVIKVGSASGTYISSGELRAGAYTYDQYTSKIDQAFISKGTLENVLTNRIGNIQTLLDNLDTGAGV